MEIKIIKNDFVVSEKNFDLCGKKQKSDLFMTVLSVLGIPSECPVLKPHSQCQHKEKIVTYSEATKRMLPLFSSEFTDSVLKIHITHDSGNSCFEMKARLEKI